MKIIFKQYICKVQDTLLEQLINEELEKVLFEADLLKKIKKAAGGALIGGTLASSPTVAVTPDNNIKTVAKDQGVQEPKVLENYTTREYSTFDGTYPIDFAIDEALEEAKLYFNTKYGKDKKNKNFNLKILEVKRIGDEVNPTAVQLIVQAYL